MKKSLIFAAVLSASAFSVTASAQSSNVQFFGDISLGVFLNQGLNGKDRSVARRVDDNESKFGIRGNEDLGGGLKAIWQIDQWISADGSNINGSGSLASRDTFLGLQGDWGKVRFGRLSSYLNSDMETPDTWTHSAGVSVAGLQNLTRFDTRYNNAIRYDSPNFYGLDFSVGVATNENDDDKNQREWFFGAGYQINHCFLKLGGVAYQHQAGGDHTGGYMRLEGGYQGDWSLIGSAQWTSLYGDDATNGTGNIWSRSTLNAKPSSQLSLGKDDKLRTFELAATASATYGSFTPRFTVAWGDNAKLNGKKLDDSGYWQFILGTDYSLSKRTHLFVSGGYVKYGDEKWADGYNDNEWTLGFGMLTAF